MRRLKEEGSDSLPVEPVGAFASQEEVGERGAMVTSVKVKPDFAVVFEGTPADDYYFRGESTLIQGGLRKGVQIRHFDRSTISNPRFIQYAADIAEEKGIRYQCAVRRGGGTNAGIITTKTKDVPTLVLGVPCRYVHTSNNFMAAEDIDAAVDLAVQTMREEKPLQLRHKKAFESAAKFCSPRTPLQSIPFGRQNEYLTVSSDCSFFDH